MLYADFESIIVPENNGKQDLDKSYTNKYQNHVGCSFASKLVRVDDNFSKPFKFTTDMVVKVNIEIT